MVNYVCLRWVLGPAFGLSLGKELLSSGGGWACHSSDSSCCKGSVLGQAHGVSTRGAQVSLLCAVWGLPESGMEPVSPAAAGRLFTREPPGKPSTCVRACTSLQSCLTLQPCCSHAFWEKNSLSRTVQTLECS